MKTIFIFLATFLLCVTSYSQVTQEWVARYTGLMNGHDFALSIAIDGSGNVYVTGYSSGGATYDYATIKYNSLGIQQWVQRYNGPGNSFDYARAIAVDGSGNVYVTGESRGNGTTYDYATIKYNSSGVQQWVQRYNGLNNDDDIARAIKIDGSGNVYVTGWSVSITGYDYATIKYNSNGDSLWVKRYNGPGNADDKAYSIAIDGSGNVYVTGYSWGSGTSYDYATIKYNSSGTQQWAVRYNGPVTNDAATSIAIDGSSNVYVTGYSWGSGTSYDYATIKYNSSGIQQWEERYNGPGNGDDLARSLAVDGSGNVYVTGWSFGSGTGDDYGTIKYNSIGDSVWVRRYNGPENDYDEGNSIAVDGLGNVYVTGLGGVDYSTIKYSSSGIELWVQRYNGPGNDYDNASSICVDGLGNVYVTGWSPGVGTSVEDYATIKYSQIIGIEPISSEIPNQFSLSQNYPNPFNPTTVIKFQVASSSSVKIIVFDILGREVATLVNEQLKPGTYEVDWDGSSFASGIYYYKIAATDYTETRKMVLLR